MALSASPWSQEGRTFESRLRLDSRCYLAPALRTYFLILFYSPPQKTKAGCHGTRWQEVSGCSQCSGGGAWRVSVRILLLFHLWGARVSHLPSLRMETWAIRNGSTHWCCDKAGHPCWLRKDLCSPCSQRTGCHRGLPLQDLCHQGCEGTSQWPFLPSPAGSCFHWSLLTTRTHSHLGSLPIWNPHRIFPWLSPGAGGGVFTHTFSYWSH